MLSNSARVMLDIETLGLEPGVAIISIGAVTFSPDGLGEEFYRSVSRDSCERHGLTVDDDTLRWWQQQDGDVAHVLDGGDPLDEVLADLLAWWPDDAEVWANSPSFDCEILEAAYAAVGMSEPWAYYDERCVRTVRNLPCAVELEMGGREHHALDDAKHQAREVAATLRRLKAVADGGAEADD